MATSSSGGKSDAAKEGPLEIAGLIAAVLAVMVFLVWMAASAKIVYHGTPALRWLGASWEWLPGEAGLRNALEVHRTARAFLSNPVAVGFFDFAGFVNLAIAPLMSLLTLACGGLLAVSVLRRPADVFRRFKDADGLMRRMSMIFTGVAPILHIRQDLARHKDPRWARQTFPEEVLLRERVHGKPLVSGASDPAHPEKMQAFPDRIEAWFMGLPPGQRPPGRQQSRTLGRQMVDLTDEADLQRFKQPPKEGQPAFSDRFGDVGKVMYAMLCAHAFGGSEGVKDAHRVRDELNNSCRGARHGLPNLKVAQWCFDKYRGNEMAHKLFAVHHWEYTYLFELFVRAKRRGKLTDGEFRWLKPADRILWYVLNTVGRFTPHTESAAAFNMHAFERKCARRKRWPLRRDENDRWVHSIFVKGAVGVPDGPNAHGLLLEWERWRSGADENDDEWWKDHHQWLTPERAVMGTMIAPRIPDANDEAARQMQATDFDAKQSKAVADIQEKARLQVEQAMAGFADE